MIISKLSFGDFARENIIRSVMVPILSIMGDKPAANTLLCAVSQSSETMGAMILFPLLAGQHSEDMMQILAVMGDTTVSELKTKPLAHVISSLNFNDLQEIVSALLSTYQTAAEYQSYFAARDYGRVSE